MLVEYLNLSSCTTHIYIFINYIYASNIAQTYQLCLSAKDECLLKRIPKPSDIYLGLFTIDIGQNDIAAVLRSSTYEKQLSAIPAIISQFVSQIRVSY